MYGSFSEGTEVIKVRILLLALFLLLVCVAMQSLVAEIRERKKGNGEQKSC